MSNDGKIGRIAVLFVIFLLIGAALLWNYYSNLPNQIASNAGLGETSSLQLENEKTEALESTVLDSGETAFVCRAAIAAMMFRDIEIISAVERADGFVGTSYKRPSDGKRWDNVCKLNGDRVIWASLQENGTIGRLRIHPDDEIVSFSLTAEGVTITQDFGSNSIIVEAYKRVKN